MPISKRDIFGNRPMSEQQVSAGRKLWDHTRPRPAGARADESVGRLSKSSYSAEDAAAKTWIRYVGPTGEERSVLECEIYVVGRVSDSNEAVVMLHGMCPKCGETFLAREDNKEMHVDTVTYRKAPKWLRVHHRFHKEEVRRERVSDNDKILLVSSPERWLCDYCKEWCVRVAGGVAKDDHRGATIISTPGLSKDAIAAQDTRAAQVGSAEPSTAVIDF